jgi:hypothetical protein
MSDERHNAATEPDSRTIPSRRLLETNEGMAPPQRIPPNAPWLLRQFFAGQIDLVGELKSRYPTVPLLAVARFKNKGVPRGSLATADGVSTLVVEGEPGEAILHLSFTYGSMMTMHFHLDDLNPMVCGEWLAFLKRETDSQTFLWGEHRWEHDYVIGIQRRQFLSLYAFSPRGCEAAVRITRETRLQMADWLSWVWQVVPPAAAPAPSPLNWKVDTGETW